MNKILVFLFVLIPALASSQWLPDLRLTNAAGNSNLSHNSQRCIGAYENNVHIVWFDDRDGNQEIYYKNSSNNGLTWSADLRLTNNASSSYLPSLNVSGQFVRVVWDDNRDGNREIYYKYSSNSGTSWSADIRLTNNTGQSYAPNISSSGQNLHLVWIENRDGNPEIYYKRSTDGGTIWSADVRLTNNSAASESPNVAVYGQTVYVIWDDGRDGSTEIYYKSSSDGGINWGTDIRLSDLPNDSGYPSFAIYDQNLHVVWYDRRDGNAEIYYKRSVNGGAAWSADIRLTNASNDSYFNNIEVYGQIVHAVWHDFRDGNAEIYYKRSMDGGTTWGTDVRLTNQSAASIYPFIALSRQFVHVAFYDNRDANYEVYYKQNPVGNAVAAVDSGSFRNKSNVPLASDYKAYFNQNMNSSTVTSGSIVFWGSMTGKKQGNLTYNSGEKSVTINPVNDFKYGELIMTTLTPMIRTSADYNILPYVWSFTSMTKPSYAVFNKTDSVTTGTNPHKIINGDIDGDGDIDIAVTNTGSNSVSILKNNGNGIFTVTSNVSLSFGPFVIASGDFDNDTDLDLAVSGGNTVTVLANNGSGAFSVFSGTGLSESGHIVPADFDGDGDLDLAVTCRASNSASILRNNGSGTFTVLSSYSLNSPQGVTAGDLDKDGDIDLCIVNYWANMVSVLKNDGSGGFTVSSTVGVGSNVDQVCNADFDNDGDLDLAVTNNGSLYISLLINNGTGAFSSSTIPADGLTGIVPADFDGDGDVDLAVNRFSQQKIAIYKNNGSASFTMFPDIYAGNAPFYLTAGDFNNNGIPDIAVTNYYNSMISMLYNLAPPVFISPANNSTGNLSGLNFYWGKSRGASNYRFQLATDSMFSNLIVNDSTLLGTDSIKYVSGLNSLTWYFWRMNSKSLNGNSLWSGTWKFKTQGVPTQVVLNTPVNNSANQPLNIAFKWFKAFDQTMSVSNFQIPADIIRPAIANTLISNSRITVSNYWFELAADAGFSNIISRDSLITDTVKSVSGLSIYTTYYWRVKAKNQSGWGVFSPVWSFTTVPPVPVAPVLVSPPNNATNQIPNLLLDWNSVTYASGYRIQIANDSLFSSLVFDTSNVIPDSLRVRNGLLGLNNKYYWRVNASNAGGTGPWSAVWNFRISPTGMFNTSSQIPNEYKLYNNYPNPFNPTTKIKFDVARHGGSSTSDVKIIVYDVMGREVQTIVNESLKPGMYETTFNGSSLTSGVYFYKIITGDFVATRKMLMIK